jgi:flagellar hook-basal body complex protein FliE
VQAHLPWDRRRHEPRRRPLPIGKVNKLETDANSAVAGLMSGNGVDVHQAMIATQKASMAFELSLAVRNKAVQAYQSVIGMQF